MTRFAMEHSPLCDSEPRELSAEECLAVAGGQNIGGAETLPGDIVEPNPFGSPVPPLGTASGT